MKNTMVFESMEAYEKWLDKIEIIDEIPCVIFDGWKFAADLQTECKSYKTALKRFEKAIADAHPAAKTYIEGMKESAEGGMYKDSFTSKDEEGKIHMYSWGIEKIDDDLYYLYLNFSGIYAE